MTAQQQGRQVQPWCQPHWDSLREAIEARGLGPWVSKGGEMAAAQGARELSGTQNDAQGFDPLLRAWSMVNGRALENGCSLWACPLCEVQVHYGTCGQPGCERSLPQEWIDGCADSLLGYVREQGLVPNVPV